MKPRCAWYRHQMEKHADALEGLPASSPAAQHLQECAGCRTFWSGLRHLGAELREALVVPAAPPSFEANAWARANAVTPQRPATPSPALAVGVLVIALLAATLVLSPWRTRATIQKVGTPRPMPLEELAPRVRSPRQNAPVQTARLSLHGQNVRQKEAGRTSPHVAPGFRRDARPHAAVRSGVRVVDRGADLPPRGDAGRQIGAAADQGDTVPDQQYLNGTGPSRLTWWGPTDGKERQQLASVLRQLRPPADDFVRIPLPLIAAAGAGKAAVAAAAREYERRAKVVDTRLFRKITLQGKGMALADFCAQMQEQTGVELRASRIVADEKVTVFVKDERARDVMRAVARLFGYLWSRSGEEGAYRYELDQDMRSQLLEEELRNHDQNAALLALDAEMQKYRPFLEVPYEELKKSAAQNGQPGKPPLSLVQGGRWGGAQLYFHLTPRSRAALTAGQELVFSPDASDEDLRFPAEWNHPILKSMGNGPDNDNHLIPISEAPGVSCAQVRLRLDRFELGEVSLMVKVLAMPSDQRGEARWTVIGPPLAVGRSPSVANPDNSTVNAALRSRSPFDRVASLSPKPSCPAEKSTGPNQTTPRLDLLQSENDPSRSYASSADLWEAVHLATGLPIVADFYTHLYPLSKVTVERRTSYEALCNVSDTLGARWRRDGDFLLCRSASYFWDKLKEVPNRYLQRWAQDRNAHGGLPLEDFLEMATMTDQQLDSGAVAEGIQRAWGLPEWGWLSRHFCPLHRYNARCLALLTSDQLRRTLEPAGLPFRELTPAQQQGVMRLEWEQYEEAERRIGGYTPIRPDLFADSAIRANYIPAGCYVALVAPESMDIAKARSVGLVEYIGGRTVPEARANADRLRPGSSSVEIWRARDGYFDAGIRFADGRR